MQTKLKLTIFSIFVLIELYVAGSLSLNKLIRTNKRHEIICLPKIMCYVSNVSSQ